ncbi:hypothetical protein [Planococcus lenghuensis]|uniref:hypothetical protein n=1 Tax=Planococcus lenghuensis TaxID=2213202 RepID=UPI0012EBC52E|nr:hypothetical protein [Planococcus lenghuensis]
MDFWIGVLAAAIAVSIVFRRGNKDRDRRTSPVLFWIGLAAAAIGLIGYLFFGWRF